MSQQLIRALRGPRSQRAASMRLGYKSVPVREWEAGRRAPTAAETMRMAELFGADPRGALLQFHPGCAAVIADARVDEHRTLGRWLAELRGSTTVVALAERTGYSRYAIARWFDGDTQIRLPEFLCLLDAITGRADDLVAALVSIDELDGLREIHQQRRAARNLAYDHPWSEVLMRFLETDAVQALPEHRADWFAERLDLSGAQVQDCLNSMVGAGIADHHSGRYRPTGARTVDTGTRPDRVRRQKHHWAQVSADRAQQPGASDLFAYNAISVSHADLAKIRGLLLQTYRQIRAIVGATDREQAVALVQLQLIDWSDEPDSQTPIQSE